MLVCGTGWLAGLLQLAERRLGEVSQQLEADEVGIMMCVKLGWGLEVGNTLT